MSTERISATVQRQTRLRVKRAAEALNISESKYIARAVEADLDKLNIRLETEAARQQRDVFKAEMERSHDKLAAALEKIAALENRSFFDRLFNRGL